MIYLYHHNNQWMCFEGELPVKPNTPNEYAHLPVDFPNYNQAIATLKSKALVVANPEILQCNDNGVVFIPTGIGGIRTAEAYDKGEIMEWPGTVEKKKTVHCDQYHAHENESCFVSEYILRLPKQDEPKKEKEPDEFVKGEPTEHEHEFFMCHDDRAYLCECGLIEFNHVTFYPEDQVIKLTEENTRLRKLIEKAFNSGYKEAHGDYTWEQFKKDNDIGGEQYCQEKRS